MQDAVAVALGDAVVLVNEMRHSTADKTSPFAAYGPQLLVVFWGGGQQEGLGNACGRGGGNFGYGHVYIRRHPSRVCQSKAGLHPEEWVPVPTVTRDNNGVN